MTKLVCPKCQRENEPERIYCHDCGARLDRSSLARVAPRADGGDTQNKVWSTSQFGGEGARMLFFKMIRVILGACVLAGLIQMLRPPDLAPVPVPPSSPPQIDVDMENALTSHLVQPLQYTEAQVNGYLASRLRQNQSELNGGLHLEQVTVAFDENFFRIKVVRTLFGFPIYTAAAAQAELRNGALYFTSFGGSIGRLPLHPALMKFSHFLFGDLWNALDRERKLIVEMGAIEFHPRMLVVAPKQ